MSLSDALNIFLAHVVRKKSLPLEEVLPQETLNVIKDARKGKNMKKMSLDELKEILNKTAGGS